MFKGPIKLLVMQVFFYGQTATRSIGIFKGLITSYYVVLLSQFVIHSTFP